MSHAEASVEAATQRATAREGTAPRARDRRRQRADVAARLMARAPEAAAALDWYALDAAPDWMAWPEPRLAALQAQVGALLCAPELRMWIDAPRLAAAAHALGAAYLRALLALPDAQVLPRDVACYPRVARADEVATLLRAAGAGVLLASLPSGALRLAAAAVLALSPPSPMASALAQSLVKRAQLLAAQINQDAS